MGIIDREQNTISEVIGIIFILSGLNSLLGIGIPYLSNPGISTIQNLVLVILGIYLIGYKRIPKEVLKRKKR